MTRIRFATNIANARPLRLFRRRPRAGEIARTAALASLIWLLWSAVSGVSAASGQTDQTNRVGESDGVEQVEQVEQSATDEQDARLAATPSGVVQRLHASLIEAMRIGSSGGYENRQEAIRDVVLDSYDFPVVGRLTLGSHWDRLEADQRERFLEVFRRLVVGNYAAEFDSYNGQRFETVKSEKQRPGLAVVRSAFTSASGKSRRFDYQLRQDDGRWLIVNVAVDGVSDLALKRSQYTTVLRRDGFEALIERLEAKVRGFAEGKSGDD